MTKKVKHLEKSALVHVIAAGLNSGLIRGAATLVLLISTNSLTSSSLAQAEETTTEQAQTKVDEVKKDAKQDVRDAKRDVRAKAGKSSVKKNLEDSANDVKDEAEYQGAKVKRKVN